MSAVCVCVCVCVRVLRTVCSAIGDFVCFSSCECVARGRTGESGALLEINIVPVQPGFRAHTYVLVVGLTA